VFGVFGLAGVLGVLGVLGLAGVFAVFAVLGLAGVFAVLGEFAVFGVFAVLGVGAVFTVGATVPVVPVGDVPVDGVAAGVPPPDVGAAEDDAGGSGPGVSAVAIAAPPRTVKPRAPVTAQAAVERLIRMMRSFRWWIPLVDRCRLLQSTRVSPEGEPNESPLTRPSRFDGHCSSPGASAGCVRTPPKPRTGARSSSEAPVVGTPRQTDAPRRDVIVVYGEAVQATSRQRTRILASGLVVVAIACGVVLVTALSATTKSGILGDLEIYRGAIGYAFGGGDLYAWVYEHPTVKGLGFTYPPFAALVLSWLVFVPLTVAKMVWTAVTFAVIAACLWLLTRPDPGTRVGGSPSTALRVAWTAGLAIPVVFTYPFLHNLVVGQVSLFVIALALFDHTLPPRWRGVLVGLAGAIKLTPLVFVPYYLLTRQWRQAAVASGTFAAATGLAFAVLPQGSLAYWTDKLWQTGRVGRTDSTVNKSLLGLLARTFGDGTATKVVWVVLVLAVAALAYWRAARAFREDDLLGATLMVGALSVAVSPISWPHHQLWLVLVAAWWLLQRGRVPLVLGLVLFAVFLGYPWFDDYQVTIDPLLRIGVELPALAVLLVLGVGPRPAAGRA